VSRHDVLVVDVSRYESYPILLNVGQNGFVQALVQRRDRQRETDLAAGKEKPCPGGDKVRIPIPFADQEFRSFIAVLISASHQGIIRRKMDDWLNLQRASTMIPALMGDRRIKDVSLSVL
jgi:hypothetical protein